MLNKHWLDSNWKGFFPKDGKIDFVARNTGVNRETLKHIGLKYSTPPDCEFNLHTGTCDLISYLKIQQCVLPLLFADFTISKLF